MAEPTYIYNPLLKKNFQKVTGGVGPAPDVVYYDLFVSNAAELIAAVSKSLASNGYYRIHLTHSCFIEGSVTLDLYNCEIIGHGHTFSVEGTITLPGGAIFRDCLITSTGAATPFLSTTHFDVVFDCCNILFERDIYFVESNQHGTIQHIIFNACSFVDEFYTKESTFLVKLNTTAAASGNHYSVVIFRNENLYGMPYAEDSSLIKVAVTGASDYDAVILDASVAWDNAYSKPAKFVQYGAASWPDNITAATLTTTGNITAGGNVVVSGNLTVNGTTTTVHAESIETEDDNITLRKNNPLGLADGEKAGLQIDNYDGNGNAAHIVTDNQGTLFCGDADSLQPLLTRLPEGQMGAGKFLVWDAANKCATTATKEIDMTYSAYQRLPESEKDPNATYYLYEEAQLTIMNADGNGNYTTQTYSSGVTVTLPVPENPDRDFEGFYTDAEYSTQAITKIVMLDDQIVYGKWANVKTYPVVIKSSIDGKTIAETRIERGQSYTLPQHTKAGNYTFNNYTIAAVAYSEGQSITVNAAVTIIANYVALSEIDLGITYDGLKLLFAPAVIENYYAWGESTTKESYTPETWTEGTYNEPSAMPDGFKSINVPAAAALLATKSDTTNFAWTVETGAVKIQNKNSLNYITLPMLGYKIGSDIAAAGSRASYNVKAAAATVLNINSDLTGATSTADNGAYGRNIICIKEVAL